MSTASLRPPCARSSRSRQEGTGTSRLSADEAPAERTAQARAVQAEDAVRSRRAADGHGALETQREIRARQAELPGQGDSRRDRVARERELALSGGEPAPVDARSH